MGYDLYMTDIQYTAYLKGSLKLSKHGEWWHNGNPFTNKRLSDLFSRSIVWDKSANEFFVQIGKQRATFTLEDTPFFVLSINDQHVPWKIELSDGTSEILEPKSLVVGDESQIYCRVKGGAFKARFSRSAHQALLGYAGDDNSLLVSGERIILKPDGH